MYENCRIYGPYNRPDRRQHVVIIYKDGRRKTISYPKYLMELKLGRYLNYDETVHHKDKDPLNNEFYNLEVIVRKEHAKQDANVKYKGGFYVCPICDRNFFLTGKQESEWNRNKVRIEKRGKIYIGPFCSRSCSGIYGREVQMGRWRNW